MVIQLTYDVAADGHHDPPAELTALPFKMHKDKDFRPYPIEDTEGKEQVWRKLVFSGSKNPDFRPARELPHHRLRRKCAGQRSEIPVPKNDGRHPSDEFPACER